MMARCLALAGLLIVVSSTISAQNSSIAKFSAAGFGRDHSFTWSQESSAELAVTSVLADEIKSQTKEQLENVGLAWAGRDEYRQPEVLVRLRWFHGTAPTFLVLAIELYDAQSKTLIWRADAKPTLNHDDSRANLLIVDRAIAKMFEHFPYHPERMDVRYASLNVASAERKVVDGHSYIPCIVTNNGSVESVISSMIAALSITTSR